MNLGIDVADLLDRLVRFHEEEYLEAGGPNPVIRGLPAGIRSPTLRRRARLLRHRRRH
jgi:hypothetical protein